MVNDVKEILVCENRHFLVFRVTPAPWMKLSVSASRASCSPWSRPKMKRVQRRSVLHVWSAVLWPLGGASCSMSANTAVHWRLGTSKHLPWQSMCSQLDIQWTSAILRCWTITGTPLHTACWGAGTSSTTRQFWTESEEPYQKHMRRFWTDGHISPCSLFLTIHWFCKYSK